MKSNPRGSWHLVALALIAVVVVVAAVLEVGPPSSSARVSHEVITAQDGVIQSTVTGSGNIEPGTQEFANFKTSGTLSNVDVSVGQHVQQGQLLATLDPTSAQLSVDQAQLSLDAAQDELTAAQDGGSSSSSGSSGSSGSGNTSNSSATVDPSATEFVSETVRRPTNTPDTDKSKKSAPSQPTSTSHTSTSTGGSHASSSSGSSASSKTTTTTTTTPTPSPAAIASAQAQVDSAELNLRTAQTTLAETRLYAPASGTIVSLESTSPGDQISAGSNSSASSSGSGSSGSGSSGSGTGSSAAGSVGGSSSSSSSSSGSGFAEIVNTGAMTMTVALSESDIAEVKVGQQATVTLDALTGVELAAHVSSISVLGTDSNGVVSYDVTLTLDQSDSQVRPGMSASAAIVTQQAQGVNLPNSAVTGGGSLSSVELLKNGKTVSTPVVVGLKGDTRTQIVSGLSAGQEVVVTTTLPSLSSSAASSASGALSSLRSRFGGGGLGGALGGGGFGGGLGAARAFGGG